MPLSGGGTDQFSIQTQAYLLEPDPDQNHIATQCVLKSMT